MKKIVLYVPAKMNQTLKTAGKEAIEEFVAIFPEYKDSFKVEIRDDAKIRDKEVSQSVYDGMPDDETKRQCILSPRGTWLLPHKSAEWYILFSRISGSDKVDVKKLTFLQGERVVNKARNEIPVCLIDKDLASPSGGVSFCYGYTGGAVGHENGKDINGDAVVVSTNACRNRKEFIKTIIIHELGHVFNATHAGRANVVENLGPHCRDNSCIMHQGNFVEQTRERLRRKTIGAPPGQPPFCKECIKSMQEYMKTMPELTRRVQAQQMPQQQQQPSQPEPVVSKPYYMPVAQPKNPSNMPPLDEWRERLQPEPHNSREWKNDLREFYKNVAVRDGDTYKENIKSQNYMARIKRSDGSTLEIEANNEYNVALGRTKTVDGDITPTLKDMRDLVKYAQQKRSGMSFDKDNTPEFNARLLIACMEAGFKSYQMKNQPQVTPEFLAKLKPETKALLQNTINNRQQQNTSGRQGGRG